MDTSRAAESFRDLLLRHRGRTGLTQLELAHRVGAGRRTVQDWEAGINHPSAELLKALILALLEADGLTAGREAAEAEEVWAAVLRDAPRMHTPFDELWVASLLRERAAPPPVPEADHDGGTVAPVLRPAEVGGERRQDWGDAPDVLRFVGRHEELAMVRDWVVRQHCRLVSVLGIGGIGKTSIAAKLAKDVAPSFHRVYWRSLRNAPPVGEWLGDAIGFLSGQQVIAPRGEAARLAALLELLRDRPNLLVLDNFETLLEPGQREGGYREGFAGYGALLRAIGETAHQSCLVVTSREAPPELAVLSGHPVRTLDLGGLGPPEAQALLADKRLSGSAADWGNLIARFGGNGLALKLVGESIRQVFGGDIGAFLGESGIGAVFGGIRRLLAEQIERSSVVEQEVLRVLAVEREPVTIGELIAELGPGAGRGAVVEAVEALRRRSLVERTPTTRAAAFTLQSVVLEYVTDRLVEEVSDEIARGQPLRLVEQPLIKAQAKDYVRQTQERLIGAPVLRHVTAQHGDAGAEQMLLALLEGWRNRPRGEQGYGPGNAVNLLRLLRGDLRGLSLAGLAIRQAYLAEVDAQDASLARAHLSEAVLAEAFNFPICVALSGDGASLVTGTSAGEVWLWRVADRTPLMAIQMRSGPVYAVALSADGRLLAGGSEDGVVRLWEVPGGRLLATLQGHAGAVRGLALSADGRLLASGSFDGTVRLWEVPSGRPLAALHGHTDAVWGVSLSANGQLLASSGQDGTVRLWEAPFAGGDAAERWARRMADFEHSPAAPSSGGRLVATLQGHTGAVWGVSLSADGRLLASGGQDATVRLWEAPGGRLVTTLEGHTHAGAGHAGGVWSVVLSADGRLLASGGLDGTVRLWGAPFATGDAVERWAGRTADSQDSAAAPPSGGRLLATLQDDTNGVWGVALTADGQLLAGSSWDGTVRLWEAQSGRPLATMEGQTGGVYSVALSAKGWLLASGGQDGTARLWAAPFATGNAVERWAGRTADFQDSAASPPSGAGSDALERWAGQREDFEHSPAAPPIGKRLVATLRGHVGAVWGVSLGADGRLLASGGQDGTVRLWETQSGGPLATLHGHTGTVFGVSLSADGRLLASCGMDGTVRLWEAPSGQQVARLEGHTNAVRGVALSADGRLLASGSFDGTVRLWEAPSGRPLATLEGHAGGVWGVALSADGQLLASGGTSGIVQLWEALGARLAATLQGHTGTVWGVALSADGRLLASGGMDGTVRLWEAPSGRPLATLAGHTGGVWGVVLSADGRLLASGSFDGTVRLWEARSGAHLHTLRSDRRYERVDVTGLTGVTAAQRVSLFALGAIGPGQATEVSDGVPLSPS